MPKSSFVRHRLHGWISAGDEILRTTDGGADWSAVHAADAAHQEELAGIFLLNSRQGWVSGSQYESSDFYGTIAQTANGGDTWSHVEVTAFDDVHFWAIAFLDARHGWVTGVQARCLHRRWRKHLGGPITRRRRGHEDDRHGLPRSPPRLGGRSARHNRSVHVTPRMTWP